MSGAKAAMSKEDRERYSSEWEVLSARRSKGISFGTIRLGLNDESVQNCNYAEPMLDEGVLI